MGPKPIIIKPKDKDEEKFIRSLFRRMGLSKQMLSVEELEDAGLVLAMSKVDRTQLVDYDRVMRELSGVNGNLR